MFQECVSCGVLNGRWKFRKVEFLLSHRWNLSPRTRLYRTEGDKWQFPCSIHCRHEVWIKHPSWKLNVIWKSIVPRKLAMQGGDSVSLQTMASGSIFVHFWLPLNLLNMPSIRDRPDNFFSDLSPLQSARGYLSDEKSFCLTRSEAISPLQSKLLSWFIHVNLYWHFTEHMSQANSQHTVLLLCRKRTLWANEHDSINQMLFWLVLRFFFSTESWRTPVCHSGTLFPQLFVRLTPEWCGTVRCKQLATTFWLLCMSSKFIHVWWSVRATFWLPKCINNWSANVLTCCL